MQYKIRDYRPGEEEYIAAAHKRVYEEEYRWGPEFSDYAMQIPRAFAAHAPAEGERMWVAEVDGVPAGSVMLCRTDDEKTGQVRLFLVEKNARGVGIGSALLSTLTEFAKRSGYERLMLLTADPLENAIRLYKRLGFSETERIANTTWSLDGKTVYEIIMEADLR